jgi:hypothetical protein
MGLPAASSTAVASASDRASLRTMKQRQRRVWRNLLTFAAITALMVVLVMARRDQQDVGRCLETMRFVATALQNEVSQPGGVPVNMPHPQTEGAMTRSHYHYSLNTARALRPEGGGPELGIACCDQPHRLFTRTDGRYVVLGDGRTFHVQWMNEDEFQRRAAELQLPAHSVVIGGP